MSCSSKAAARSRTTIKPWRTARVNYIGQCWCFWHFQSVSKIQCDRWMPSGWTNWARTSRKSGMA